MKTLTLQNLGLNWYANLVLTGVTNQSSPNPRLSEQDKTIRVDSVSTAFGLARDPQNPRPNRTKSSQAPYLRTLLHSRIL